MEEEKALIPIPEFKAGDVLEPYGGMFGCKRVIFLDVETTGLDPDKNRIIELACVECLYKWQRPKPDPCYDFLPAEDYIIKKVVSVHSYLEDPGAPIPSFITELTGITDDMVQGKKIPDDEIEKLFTSDESFIVICHNTPFDRSFFNRRFPELEKRGNFVWGDSCNAVHWCGLYGHKSKHLPDLLRDCGYQYTAHRALNDCFALILLMRHAYYFEACIRDTEQEHYLIVLPFETDPVMESMIGSSHLRFSKGPYARFWSMVVTAADLSYMLSRIYRALPFIENRALKIRLLQPNEVYDRGYWLYRYQNKQHKTQKEE